MERQYRVGSLVGTVSLPLSNQADMFAIAIAFTIVYRWELQSNYMLHLV
jgi:hypothetical protein